MSLLSGSNQRPTDYKKGDFWFYLVLFIFTAHKIRVLVFVCVHERPAETSFYVQTTCKFKFVIPWQPVLFCL